LLPRKKFDGRGIFRDSRAYIVKEKKKKWTAVYQIASIRQHLYLIMDTYVILFTYGVKIQIQHIKRRMQFGEHTQRQHAAKNMC